MRAPKQIAASRVNGARSKGPATPEGKRNSSRNSTRHGMFADTLVLEKENPTQFHELLNELLDEHQPSTPTHTLLVETIVAARWRQQRICGIRKTNFDYGIASIETNPENPASQAVFTLRRNDGSIRSYEHCSASKSPSMARSPEPSIASSSSRIKEPTETRSTAPVSSEPAPLDAVDLASHPKKNDFAKRTHQPIENTTHAGPLEPSDAADLAHSKKNDFAKRTHHTSEIQRRPSGGLHMAIR